MRIELPDFSTARVLVVGDVMLDRYWHGNTSRISPEAPVPVVRVDEAEERPGGAANVALNIVALGGHASLLGITGDDEAADALDKRLKSAGIDSQLLRDKRYPTITKLRVLSRHQQLIRLDFEDGFGDFDNDRLLARMRKLLPDFDVVVFSDYGKGTLRDMAGLIAAARKAGKPAMVDPKGDDFGKYAGASLITPNLGEFEAVVGTCHDDKELVERGQAMIRELRLDALLVTRSERGMSLMQSEGPALHLPTQAREVYDVTGAGDTVISVLATALAAGQDAANATALANLAAGIVVGKVGTAAVSVPELRRAVYARQEGRGVLSEAELMLAVGDARAHGETIVMTNGCFDILHAGHVTYLESARRLGDRLIVAVNTDESVSKIKGPERPINTLERRMAVLAGLGCVDWVVAFTEDTPTRLICALAPDILVKGGDNDPFNIPGGDCVREAGGEVRVLDYVEQCSTTRTIEAIQARRGGE